MPFKEGLSNIVFFVARSVYRLCHRLKHMSYILKVGQVFQPQRKKTINDDERVVGRVWAAGLLVGVGSWAEGHFDSVVCVFAKRRL